MSAGGDRRPPATVHVDLDGARTIFAAHGWRFDGADDPLFTSGLEGALEMLARARKRATLFVVAADLEDAAKLRLLRQAAGEGHEIASHSATHADLTALDRSGKRREIAGSRAALGAALGVAVDGFRAPGFRLDAECVELLAEAGYAYDSSIVARSRSAAAARRALAGRRLREIPVPTRTPLALPFHPSYALVLGERYFAGGVESWRRRGRPFVLLFHLTDFADPLPAARLAGWRQRLYTLSHLSAATKRKRCAAMLDRVGRSFRLATTAELLADGDAAAAARSENGAP